MAKLMAMREEEERESPNPKKQRRESVSQGIEEEQQDEEPGDVEDGEEGELLMEDERATGTPKIDEECDGEEESREDDERRFFLTDLEFFDCTVCLQRLSVPIVYLCENEHVACSGCFSSSSVCTICTPSASYKRSRILEKILKAIGESCENLKYGCKRLVHYTMKVDHEKYCKFVPCSCPIEGCNFVAPSMQLSMHLSNNHSDSITCFSFNRSYSITLGHDERFCVLQEINSGDMFVIINVKHDIGNLVSVNQIGPRSFSSPFSLDLNTKDGRRLSLQFKCEIESIRSLVDDEALIRDFLLVPSRYFEGDEGFDLLICISHSDA